MIKMKGWNKYLLLIIPFIGVFATKLHLHWPKTNVSFYFKGKKCEFSATMRKTKNGFTQRGGLSRNYLDTIASCFYVTSGFVEILRQDHPFEPTQGIALGFEFDENTPEYPYFPVKGTIQLRNYTWGGVEFSANDSLNYTGLTNAVSDDVFFEIQSFRNDTIEGRFSGLLLSGSGDMGQLDSGYFKVRLYRKNR
jgi:hypothetical protein